MIIEGWGRGRGGGLKGKDDQESGIQASYSKTNGREVGKPANKEGFS